MRYRLLNSALCACAAACAASPPSDTAERPLDVLSAGHDPALVRSDLLATARERYGDAAVERALSAATRLIVKRFAGMPPPPPPGAEPDWRAPTPSIMLIREGDRWLAATQAGWRPANAEGAARIEQLIGSARFWNEPAYVPPCPDFGASNLLLKVPGRRETVRNALCSSAAAELVEAALRA